jgi:hypothetical protein
MDRTLTGANYKKLALRSGRRDEIVFDREISSLALRVYASGAGRWIVQYRPPGADGLLSRMPPKRFVIGDHTSMSLSQARVEAIKTLASIRSGIDP